MVHFDRPGDVMLADCAARTTLELVSGTWSIVVVYALGKGPRRFSDLSLLIGGISNKMLSQTLRKLERNGLIQRRAIRASPPGAEYRLTALGESLLEPIDMLSRWAETHADDVVQAQDPLVGV
jgi:DNA-binding HxlR family transcriptional regulator